LIYLDEVAAKVAAHAADCYKEAYTSAKTESAKKIIPEVGGFLFFIFHKKHQYLMITICFSFLYLRILSILCLSNIYYFNQKQNFMLVIKHKLIENMDLK
jgi:hypothetical protein